MYIRVTKSSENNPFLFNCWRYDLLMLGYPNPLGASHGQQYDVILRKWCNLWQIFNAASHFKTKSFANGVGAYVTNWLTNIVRVHSWLFSSLTGKMNEIGLEIRIGLPGIFKINRTSMPQYGKSDSFLLSQNFLVLSMYYFLTGNKYNQYFPNNLNLFKLKYTLK